MSKSIHKLKTSSQITLWLVYNCYWPKENHASIWLVPHGRDFKDFNIPQEFGDSEDYIKFPAGMNSHPSEFIGKNCVKIVGPVPEDVAIGAMPHIKKTFECLGYSVDEGTTADD